MMKARFISVWFSNVKNRMKVVVLNHRKTTVLNRRNLTKLNDETALKAVFIYPRFLTGQSRPDSGKDEREHDTNFLFLDANMFYL